MSAGTGIEWTDATWNPLTGCTKVSPGCDSCYAQTLHERFHGAGSFGTINLHPGRLTQPLRWERPRRIFVNSMSDLFHAAVPDEYIAQVFAIMAAAPAHTFQVLTKRHARMRAFLAGPAEAMIRAQLWAWAHEQGLTIPGRPRRGRSDPVHHNASCWFPPKGLHQNIPWPLRNVWAGVSVENQHWADIRIPALLGTPAAVRWISAEPLLGPVSLHQYTASGWGEDAQWNPSPSRMSTPSRSASPVLDWVVAGGESGPRARPMHPAWAATLRDQCAAANTPFLFKQWGNWAPIPPDHGPGHRAGDISLTPDGDRYAIAPGSHTRPEQIPGTWLRRTTKHAAGRHLDGRTHDEYPATGVTRHA